MSSAGACKAHSGLVCVATWKCRRITYESSNVLRMAYRRMTSQAFALFTPSFESQASQAASIAEPLTPTVKLYWAVVQVTPFFRDAHYSRVPKRRNHRNDPASVFLSTHWWSQHPACQRWLFLVVSCVYKPLRNCHPSQWVSKVLCKKPAKKNISMLRFYNGFLNRFYVDFLRDFVFLSEILCWPFTRFYVFVKNFVLEEFV